MQLTHSLTQNKQEQDRRFCPCLYAAGACMNRQPRLAKWIIVVSFITNLSDTAAFILVNILWASFKLDFGIGLYRAVL